MEGLPGLFGIPWRGVPTVPELAQETRLQVSLANPRQEGRTLPARPLALVDRPSKDAGNPECPLPSHSICRIRSSVPKYRDACECGRERSSVTIEQHTRGWGLKECIHAISSPVDHVESLEREIRRSKNKLVNFSIHSWREEMPPATQGRPSCKSSRVPPH